MKKTFHVWIGLFCIVALATLMTACGPVGGIKRPTATAATTATPTTAPPTAETLPTATSLPATPVTPPVAQPAGAAVSPGVRANPGAGFKTQQLNAAGDIIAALPLTPAPTAPVAASGKTVANRLPLPFYDDFSDPHSGWITRHDEAGSSDYANGAFRMKVGKANWLMFSGVPVYTSDVIIEVDVQNVGTTDDNSFGAYCRGNGDSYYYMEAASDGYYKIARFVEDKYTELVPWTATTALHAGRSVNHLRVDCVSNTLRFYANGTLLTQVRDTTFDAGYIGLTAGSFDTPGVDILFDNFSAVAPAASGSPTPSPTPQPTFSDFAFAEDVTDDGELISPASVFPDGTTTVWVYFSYENMEDGRTWGLLWEQDGEPYEDMRDLVWEDGPSGWLAYGLTQDEGLDGHFALTLFLDGRSVQTGSFDVGEKSPLPPGGDAAFGAIQFAAGATNEGAPIGAASEFDAGTTEVYAVFPFMNMRDGQTWSREWLYEDEVLVRKDVTWDEGPEGLTYFYFSDESGLDAGRYALNLYIGDQLARSASFEVIGKTVVKETPEKPATPEELFDPEILPAWRILANADNDLLKDLANFALRHRIEIRMDNHYKGNAAYQATCNRQNPQPGHIVVSRQFWKESSWEFVAATLGHELTHAVQHLNGGKCECTVEKEYYAWLTTLYVLQELDRMDLLEARYRGVYDQQGRFDKGKLWAAVKKTYSECSEY